MQKVHPESALLPFVRKYLLTEGVPCGRHCKDPVRFAPIHEEGESIVGAYVCPQNYISRVVYFSSNPNAKWFESLLAEQAGRERVRERDVRVATRHGWELGRDAEDEIEKVAPGGLKQYYWTFYPKSDEDKKSGTFLCARESGGCGKMFTKSIEDKSRFCPECSRSISGRAL
ncbi:MAG: hypothetical protein ACRECH_17785 [Nitrososphaerales archaeon]